MGDDFGADCSWNPNWISARLGLGLQLVLAYSLIACRNYPSILVDRAPQDREQPLELAYQSLRRIILRRL
jgi:hypothetical protein